MDQVICARRDRKRRVYNPKVYYHRKVFFQLPGVVEMGVCWPLRYARSYSPLQYLIGADNSISKAVEVLLLLSIMRHEAILRIVKFVSKSSF